MKFWLWRWRIIEVYDGDGFKMRVHCWPPFCKTVNVRILKMDAPEMDGQTKWERDKAIKARDYLRRRLRWALWITVDVKKWDKWGGRVLAYVNVNGRCIAEQMIELGLARLYDGGKREEWKRSTKKKNKEKMGVNYKLIIATVLSLTLLFIYWKA